MHAARKRWAAAAACRPCKAALSRRAGYCYGTLILEKSQSAQMKKSASH